MFQCLASADIYAFDSLEIMQSIINTGYMYYLSVDRNTSSRVNLLSIRY